MTKVLKLLLLFVCVVILSCANMKGSNPEPIKESFLIPAITLNNPDPNLGFKIPVTAARINKKFMRGIVVYSENIAGFETFKVVVIKATRVRKNYAFILVDDTFELHAGDQIIDYIPESLQKINEYRHDWLVDCFQRGKLLKR